MTEVENGNGRDRATIALVSAQIATVEALVVGSEKTTTAGFKDVQRQLDHLVNIPERLAKVETGQAAVTERVKSLEDATNRRPALAVAIIAVVVAVAGAALQVLL